jgi:N6-adenosine-specific RNA methylase IME4
MIPFPDKKYQIIYADPPWEMGNKSKNRVLVPKYDVMESTNIIKLPIENITANNCALFLWVINAKIPDALKLIEKIGFRYVGVAFCWVKTSQKTGIPNCRMAGNYTLQGIELCLLAIRGHIRTKDRTVRQVLMHPRLFHSKKPDIVADEIIRLFGDLPRIELFARDKKQGWDAWGSEV